jgi:tricorn protease
VYRPQTSFAVLLVVLVCFSFVAAQAEETRILRFPDIHQDKVVFAHGGDLWLVDTQGGIARRLTSDAGLELFPKFSPDGSLIAFTGQYDGNTDVYLIPAQGGEPKRLTYRPGFENMSDRFVPHGKATTAGFKPFS